MTLRHRLTARSVTGEWLCLAMLLVTALSLAANAGAAVYLFVWQPAQRQLALARIGSLIYGRPAVALMGDSLLAGVETCRGALNWAVPGATVRWTRENQVAHLAVPAPGSVVLLLGINDLRYGRSPEAVHQDLMMLLDAIEATVPGVAVAVLSVLPVVEGAPAALGATNHAVDALNALLRRTVIDRNREYWAIDATFEADGALAPWLTFDGLHLNGAGNELLKRALWHGIAVPALPAEDAC